MRAISFLENNRLLFILIDFIGLVYAVKYQGFDMDKLGY